MTDRELDCRCAEILGWTKVRYLTCGYVGAKPDSNCNLWDVRFYSTSLDACRELLEWADSNGELNRLMGMTLTRMLDKSPMDERGYVPLSMLRKIWLATPRQICEAFVETFGKEPR